MHSLEWLLVTSPCNAWVAVEEHLPCLPQWPVFLKDCGRWCLLANLSDTFKPGVSIAGNDMLFSFPEEWAEGEGGPLLKGWGREENISTPTGMCTVLLYRCVNKSCWRRRESSTYIQSQTVENEFFFFPGKANAARAEAGRVCGGLNLWAIQWMLTGQLGVLVQLESCSILCPKLAFQRPSSVCCFPLYFSNGKKDKWLYLQVSPVLGCLIVPVQW